MSCWGGQKTSPFPFVRMLSVQLCISQNISVLYFSSGPWYTYKMVIPDFFVIPIYSAEVKLVQSETRTRLGFRAALVIALISFSYLLIRWNGVGSFFFGLLRRLHLAFCLWIHSQHSLNLPDVHCSI